MSTTWILVADAARARLFEAPAADAALTEIACFDDPDARAGARRLGTGRPPSVNESAGPARHAIEPHTTAREKLAVRFARQLAEALELGRTQNRFRRLILVAPARFLGELHQHLERPLRDCIVGEVRRDLTELPVAQIRAHLPGQLFEAA